MSADTDVETGFANRWNNSNLAKQVAGGFWTGRVPALDSAGVRRQMPYAVAKSDKAKEPQYFTYTGDGTDTYIDFRRLSLTIYGLGEKAVGDLTELAKGLYDRKTFPIPNVVYLTSCLSQGEPTIDEDPTSREGENIWRGQIQFEVATSRLVPSAP